MMNDEKLLMEVRGYVRKALSKARYQHTINVAALAAELARAHGANVFEATLAGLLHDSTKEKTLEEHLKILQKYNIVLAYNPKEMPTCVHADTSALAAKYAFGASGAVCNAIKSHTLACESMTALDKIIYIADKCEVGRDKENVEAVRWRNLAKIDLDSAMETILIRYIEYLRLKGVVPYEGTLKALSFIARQGEFQFD